ncbi:MAG: class I SAM-dependent methyltransferase [Rhodothermia bacterium]|nr:class I SAM-dependent methyltransferase [Rhodothermia bacterium]
MIGRQGAGSVEDLPTGWDPAAALTESEMSILTEYVEMLTSFNRRVNLVSRDSIEEAWTRHVVHSLFLCGRGFSPGSTVVDWGTGGGLPLIPLAVTHPDVRFVGIDAVEKKVLAVRTMIRRLGIGNAEVWAGRAETWTGQAEYSVSRATAPLITLWEWHERVALETEQPTDGAAHWAPGLICLKGGDISEEIEALEAARPGIRVQQWPLDSTIYDGQFDDKAIVTVALHHENESDG